LLLTVLCVGVGASPAAAANGCGSGYHKQEDGGISGSKSGSQSGRKLTASVSGWVRWCTRGKFGRDQFFQRVKVGVPSPITWRAAFAGRRRKVCLTSQFTATIANGSSAGISIATNGAGATITSNGQSSKTATLTRLCRTGAAAQSTSAFQQVAQNFSVTVPSCGFSTAQAPRVKSITFSTVAYVQYKVGSEIRDYSLRSSNTDRPNDVPFFNC
jgi:hypothetical protein